MAGQQEILIAYAVDLTERHLRVFQQVFGKVSSANNLHSC